MAWKAKTAALPKTGPPYHILDVGDNKTQYCNSVLDKLISEPTSDDEEGNPEDPQDLVRNYSLCVLNYFLLYFDFKDAIKEGNGERIATFHKQLLLHFNALPGFNQYAIEMLISIVQNEVFL